MKDSRMKKSVALGLLLLALIGCGAQPASADDQKTLNGLVGFLLHITECKRGDVLTETVSNNMQRMLAPFTMAERKAEFVKVRGLIQSVGVGRFCSATAPAFQRVLHDMQNLAPSQDEDAGCPRIRAQFEVFGYYHAYQQGYRDARLGKPASTDWLNSVNHGEYAKGYFAGKKPQCFG
jgi:hypothetical protein